MGIYNSDGSIAITEVTGQELTGVQAPDGSINVVIDDAFHTGLYHPSGAFRVNSSYGDTVLDPSGAYYINTILGTRGAGSFPSVEDYTVNEDGYLENNTDHSLWVYITDSDGVYLTDDNGVFYMEAA